MLEMTYLKEYHDEDGKLIISFEGDAEDVYAIRNYAAVINSAQEEVEADYYRGFVSCESDYVKDECEMIGYDIVNKPKHYADSKIEVIDYIEDKRLGFCLGNVIKYVSRAGKKHKEKEIEDLQKARWYLDRRIYELENGLDNN